MYEYEHIYTYVYVYAHMCVYIHIDRYSLDYFYYFLPCCLCANYTKQPTIPQV